MSKLQMKSAINDNQTMNTDCQTEMLDVVEADVVRQWKAENKECQISMVDKECQT